MRKWMVVIALVIAIGTATMQPLPSITTTTCPGNVTAAGCVVIPTQRMGSMSATITGTFTGTIQFEWWNGQTWVSQAAFANGSTTSVTSTTTTGTWKMDVTGASEVRFRFSAFTSGTAVISTSFSQARLPGTGPGGAVPSNLVVSTISLGNGSEASPSMLFTNDTPGSGAGFYRPSVGDIAFLSGGVARLAVDGASIQLRSAQTLDWSSGALGSASDTTLSRGAANRLDLATGDSFNLVSGGLSVGAGAITTAGRMGALTMQLTPQASPPSTPAAGWIYVDTTGNELCFYDGSAWQGISTGTDASCA